jgi:hypothetical protein
VRGDKKGIRQKPGQVLRIPLGDGTYGYCQMVDKVRHAFFDFSDNGEKSDIEKILSSKMIFKCTVDSYVINKGYWEIIGSFPIKEHLTIYEKSFSYNHHSNRYQIFKQGTGFIPASWEEIKDLEPFASWGHTHIEQRLRDHFAGRPNYHVEGFKSHHLGKFCDMDTFYKPYGCVLVDKENWIYAPPYTKISYD